MERSQSLLSRLALRSRAEIWFGSLLGIAILARLYHFAHPPDDAHQWRQTFTLINIQSYAHGAAPLIPRGNWYGLVWRPDGLELPLYSIVAYGLSKVMGLLAAARLESFLLSIAAIVLFDRLCAWGGHPRRRTATVLFALAPITIFYGHSVQPDAMLITLLIAAGYGAVRATGGGRGWLPIAAICIAAASAIKPTALVTLAPALVYLGWRHRQPWRYAALIAAGGAAALGWAFFDRAELLATNPDWYAINATPGWVFGTTAQRLSPYTYSTLLGRASLILLSPLMVGLLIRTAGDRIGDPFWWWWLAGGVASVLIFANLNIVHFYYQLPIVPALAALAAYGAPKLPARVSVRAVTALGILALTAIGCRDLYQEDPRFSDAGQALALVATPDRPVIAMSAEGTESWYPILLYYTGHPGWVLPLDADAERIDSLSGPPPCDLVMLFDGPGSRKAPAGWREVRRTPDYVVAHRIGGAC